MKMKLINKISLLRGVQLDISNLIKNEQDASVGADIRALRKSRNIRLKRLANDLNRSTGWLSQIERGQTEPSISDLRNIATYFEIPLSFFFRNEQAADGEQGLITRNSKRAALGSKHDGLVEELLSCLLYTSPSPRDA